MEFPTLRTSPTTTLSQTTSNPISSRVVDISYVLDQDEFSILILSAHAVTQSGQDAWVSPPLDYFPYSIETVNIALPPSSEQLPGGASQTITAKAIDQNNQPILGLTLTFKTDFGSFTEAAR